MPVGVEDGRIPDGALTASSYHSENYHPSRARLNLLSTKYCWAAKKNVANQWLQVCFHLFSSFAFHCNRRVVSSRSLFLEGPDNYQIIRSMDHARSEKLFLFTYEIEVVIERFHMTSRWPYWCSKTMKRPPCWCTKTTLRELNSFLM